MNNISEQVMSVINQIAEKLGVAAEKLYPILRKQATIDGVSGLALLTLSIITLYFLIKLLAKATSKEKESRYDGWEKWFAAQIFLYVGLGINIIYTLISIFTINGIITALLNPDWYIIQNILKQLIK